MNLQFGTGVLYGLPNAGNTATNPTPYEFGVLQEASVEFKADLKKLFGQNQFPVAKARGKIDVSGKAKLAMLDPNMLNQLYFGQASASGITQLAVKEAGTVASATVTVTNSANFVTDYGVIDGTTGQAFIKVTSAPSTGQYSVSAGVYTFNVGDNGKAVKITYSYTVAAVGSTITLSNQLMGFAPELRVFLFNVFRTKRLGLELFNITLGTISIPTKQEDFWMVDITFEACTDASDVLGKLYADIS